MGAGGKACWEKLRLARGPRQSVCGCCELVVSEGGVKAISGELGGWTQQPFLPGLLWQARPSSLQEIY